MKRILYFKGSNREFAAYLQGLRQTASLGFENQWHRKVISIRDIYKTP